MLLYTKKEGMSMFRAMQRKKQALSQEECIQILKAEPRGVLSVFGDNGYPYGIPLNHWYCEADGRLYFHSGENGHKIDALRTNPKVSYCVYDSGFQRDGDWALTIKSVVVFGHAEIVKDHAKAIEISRSLSYKFTNDDEYIEKEIHSAGHRVLVFSVCIDHMSGKTVNEK